MEHGGRQRTAIIWGVTIGLMSGLTAVGLYTPLHHALFPEMAALTLGLLSQPRGPWARQPWAVALMPTFAGILGVALSAWLGFSVLAVALSVSGTLLLLRLGRSQVMPSIAAGLLPIVLELRDPLYPVTLFLSGWLLVGIHAWYVQRFAIAPVAHAAPAPEWRTKALIVVFASGVALLAALSGLRFLLFPPLVVLTAEMLENPACPWGLRPVAAVLTCAAAAVVGVALQQGVGRNPLAVALVLLAILELLRRVRLPMPPALAVGLIPFVMPHPTWAYPLSVATGLALGVACRALARPLLPVKEQQPVTESALP